jgi:hypothetical protein
MAALICKHITLNNQRTSIALLGLCVLSLVLLGGWSRGVYADEYVGEYKDDKYHGQGTNTYADGRVKEGIWKNDVFQYARKG